MENQKENLRKSITDNITDYFANSISSSDFIDKFIKPFVPISEEQEQEITTIISEYNNDWDNAECDPEGATEQQALLLDEIIELTVNAVLTVVIV
jgi:hypothetical protein